MRGGRPIIFLVARREIRLRLRSRVFKIGTAAMIGLIAIGILAATALSGRTSASPVDRVAFTITAKALEPVFIASAAAAGTQVTVRDVSDLATGTRLVTAGSLDVLVSGSPTAPVAVVAGALPVEVESALDVAVLEARMAAAGITPATVTSIINGTNVAVHDVASAASSRPEFTTQILGALAVAILLYVTLGLYGSLVGQGVVEEKSTRIVEVLLATMRPSQLLTGKVIGIGFVGLLQLSVVGAATLILATATHFVSIPAVSLPSILGDLAWFALGFLFYAMAIAALASTVSRQEEVAGVTIPVNIFLIGGYLLVFVVLPDPANTMSTVLSILPPFAPVLMSVRIATGDATAWQVALAVVLMIASIASLTRLAGRIYANSILRVGKRVQFGVAFRGR